jgi:hypothetical protein
MPSPIIKSVPSIVWGTYNAMTAPAGAVIISGKVTPKNRAPIEIEDGNGFAISEIVLRDGFDASFDLLFDSTLSWPNAGSNCVVLLPCAGYNTSANTNTAAFTCLIGGDPAIDLARKREATITYNLTYRPGVAV